MGGAQLVPADAWWTAWWWEDRTITIDIITPASIADHALTYLDLEIDLWADGRGGHGVTDLDEYVTARAAGLISDEQHDHVQAAVAALDDQLAHQVEPFGDVGWGWLSGVIRNRVNVTAYDAQWPRRFEAARDQIWPLLPPGSRVEHVGSTAVPGLAAKDIVDIAVIVPSSDLLEPVIARLEGLGYQARPAAFDDDPGHVFLRKLGNGRRSQHLHLYVDGNPNLIGVLAVRDLLRVDSEARRRYEEVKVALAEAEPYDLGAYIDGKDATVNEILEAALGRREASL